MNFGVCPSNLLASHVSFQAWGIETSRRTNRIHENVLGRCASTLSRFFCQKASSKLTLEALHLLGTQPNIAMEANFICSLFHGGSEAMKTFFFLLIFDRYVFLSERPSGSLRKVHEKSDINEQHIGLGQSLSHL